MMISVYVTCANMAEARKIAGHLVRSKLAACANIFPIESVFSWKGKNVRQKEAAMLLKAKKAKYHRIESEIRKIHSYEVPCIVAFDWAASNPGYKKWVMKNG